MRSFLLFFALLAVSQCYGQDNLGDWYFTLANGEPKIREENQLIISVDLPQGWGLYSSDFTAASIGPLPTVFDFDSSTGIQIVEPVKAIKSLTIEDDSFGLRYTYFISKAEFRQCIRLTTTAAHIKGVIRGHLFEITTGKTISFEKPIDLNFPVTTATK